MDIVKILEIAKKLAKEAGEKIMEVYSTDFDIQFKNDLSPLTLADKLANDLIVEGLSSTFPTIGILTEEAPDSTDLYDKKFCFIIDPLDGTKEFINRNGEFTVNIALSCQGYVIMGVVYVPTRDELYFGLKGKGAFMQKGNYIESLQVSQNINKLKLAVSRSHSSKKEQSFLFENQNRILETIAVGSSLKGCLVASGAVDAYYRFGPTMEWDTAAMHAICEEAGAIVRQMEGSALLYNRRNHLNEKGFYILNREESRLQI